MSIICGYKNCLLCLIGGQPIVAILRNSKITRDCLWNELLTKDYLYFVHNTGVATIKISRH